MKQKCLPEMKGNFYFILGQKVKSFLTVEILKLKMLKKWTAKDIQLKISKQKEKKKEKFINRETAETARKKESYEEDRRKDRKKDGENKVSDMNTLLDS